MALLSTLTTFL